MTSTSLDCTTLFWTKRYRTCKDCPDVQCVAFDEEPVRHQFSAGDVLNFQLFCLFSLFTDASDTLFIDCLATLWGHNKPKVTGDVNPKMAAASPLPPTVLKPN